MDVSIQSNCQHGFKSESIQVAVYLQVLSLMPSNAMFNTDTGRKTRNIKEKFLW